jgi:hypothetical protein
MSSMNEFANSGLELKIELNRSDGVVGCVVMSDGYVGCGAVMGDVGRGVVGV